MFFYIGKGRYAVGEYFSVKEHGEKDKVVLGTYSTHLDSSRKADSPFLCEPHSGTFKAHFVGGPSGGPCSGRPDHKYQNGDGPCTKAESECAQVWCSLEL